MFNTPEVVIIGFDYLNATELKKCKETLTCFTAQQKEPAQGIVNLV